MERQKKKRLSLWLTGTMVFAMIMGPGPGLRLVNPGLNDPIGSYFVFGLPIIYAWGLLWFAVQLAVVIVAYRTVWVSDDEPASSR